MQLLKIVYCSDPEVPFRRHVLFSRQNTQDSCMSHITSWCLKKHRATQTALEIYGWACELSPKEEVYSQLDRDHQQLQMTQLSNLSLHSEESG